MFSSSHSSVRNTGLTIASTIFSILLIIGFTTPALAISPHRQEVKLQLRWLHQFQFAGYYAAIEKGYYEDIGLKVTLAEGGVAIDTVQEVVSGRAQYGVTNSEILLHRLKGEPIVVLAAIFQHSPLVFLTRRDSGITNPQGLVGKRVKMTLGSRDIELLATLKNEGIDIDELALIEGGTTAEDYFDPTIDAISAYLTNQPKLLEDKNIAYTLIKPSVYGVDFYGDSLFTSEQELRDNPERVRAFRKASLKGWQYAMAHPEEITTLILEKYSSRKSRDSLEYEAEKMRELIVPDLVEMGHMNPGRWQHIGTIFKDHGIVSKDSSLEGFIYDPTTSSWERNKNLLLTVLAIFSWVFVIVCLVTAFLFRFNKKLKDEITKHEQTTKALKSSQETISSYSRQIEQFSLAAASVLTIKDIKQVGQIISQALVENSDYKRVLISVFNDKTPYREIIGYAGVEESVIERIQGVELPAHWYDNVFKKGIPLGQLSYYIPHTMKDMLNQEATVYGNGPVPPAENGWHPQDNLFVRMNDENGVFIGVISVDNSKSGKTPNDELVGPLEIFSSLISQIVVLKREHEKRTQLEDRLRQAQKMEAIGNLTGGIAHDFNNILSAILGNAELAMLSPTLEPRVRNHFKEILTAGSRARDIVQQLLSFSRKSVTQSKPVDVRLVIEDALNFLRSTIPSSIQIQHQSPSEPIIIKADQTQIYQIMINLFTNATHAMEHGGEIAVTLGIENIETPQDQVEWQGVERVAKIIVSDTGQGIDPLVIDKIFDPYFTTKEVGKGTGIGLAAVHGIVNSHGGHIEVTSDIGKGTTFIISFPALNPDLLTPPDDSTESDHTGSGRILLVDDEPSLLMVGKEMLQHLGYGVDTFQSPLEALTAFTKNPETYRLVITDFTMPEMTGDLLAKELLALRQDLPIIICTGFTEVIDSQDKNSTDSHEILIKPFTIKSLTETIEKVAQRSK